MHIAYIEIYVYNNNTDNVNIKWAYDGFFLVCEALGTLVCHMYCVQSIQWDISQFLWDFSHV